MCFGSSVLVLPRTYLCWAAVKTRSTTQHTQERTRHTDKSTQHVDLPTTLNHKDGRLVVLGVDPVEQHPQVQILLLPKLQAVVDELEAQGRSVREGEEVGRSPHLLPLLPGEGGQPWAQPRLHAGRVVSVCEQRPGEPAQDVVQGALALSQAFQAGTAGLDPVRGQRHGQLALLTGTVVAVVAMPCSCMSLEEKQTDRQRNDGQTEAEEEKKKRLERMVGRTDKLTGQLKDKKSRLLHTKIKRQRLKLKMKRYRKINKRFLKSVKVKWKHIR